MRRPRRSFRSMRRRRMLRRRLRPEVKTFDSGFGPVSVSNSVPGIFGLTLISQGLTNLDRVGNKVLLKSFLFRASITQAATAVNPSILRIILLRDQRVGTSAPPIIADLLQVPLDINSPLNIEKSKDFRILKDYYIKCTPPPNAHKYHINYFKKMANVCSWSSSAANDFNGGHLHCILVSDTNIAVDEPSITAYARVRYTDV